MTATIRSKRQALAIFIITARLSASTGQTLVQTPNGTGTLPLPLGAGRIASTVRRHETQSEHLAEANRSSDSTGNRRVVVVAANGDSSVHSPIGGGTSAQTLNAGRPAAMVRRHETQGKHVAEVAANGESSIQSLLSHALDASHPAAVVRRHETPGRHLADVAENVKSSIQSLASHTLDASRLAAVVRRHEGQDKHIAEMAANGERSAQSFSSHILDASHPAAKVRRRETQDKHLVEVAANGDGSIQSMVRRQDAQRKHLTEVAADGRPAAVVRRHETQSKHQAKVAANDDDPIQSVSDAERPLAVVRRHESQSEHRARAKDPIDIMRSRRTAIVVATHDSSIPSGRVLTVAKDDPSLPLMSTRIESPEHVSAHRAAMPGSPMTTFGDFTAASGTASPRKDTPGPGPVSGRDEARFSSNAERLAFLRDKFAEFPHTDVQSEIHIGVKGLEANLNVTSSTSALAHASVSANTALTSRSVAASPALATHVASSGTVPEKSAIVAPGVRKTNLAGLAPVLEAVMAEIPTSAVQHQETTTFPVTTTAPVMAALATPPPTEPAPSHMFQFCILILLVLILLCGLSLRHIRTSADNSSDRRRSLARSFSERRQSSKKKNESFRMSPQMSSRSRGGTPVDSVDFGQYGLASASAPVGRQCSSADNEQSQSDQIR